MIVGLISTHLIIAAASNLKAKKYFQRDGKVAEKKEHLLEKSN